jgi:hypothetical protein
MPILITLHVLAAVVWLGGMFFAYMVLTADSTSPNICIHPYTPHVHIRSGTGSDLSIPESDCCLARSIFDHTQSLCRSDGTVPLSRDPVIVKA